jgi:chromosome segregation ATPase
MGWIFGKEVDDKVEALDRALKDSFDRVRQDTDAIYQWISYLQQTGAQHQQLIEAQHHDLDDAAEIIAKHEEEISRQRQLIERLQTDLRSVPKDSETIKRVIDAYYDFDGMMDRIRQTEAKLTKIEHMKQAPAPVHREAALPHVAQPHEEHTRTMPAFKDKIVQRITRNSKEYLKGLIMSMITKYGKISALQLREMIVEEQGLASKSSFYRLIEELEDEHAVTVVSDGKEKVLAPSGVAKHVKEGYRR